ncbi:hypothetical protein RND61_24365 [Streptomyces sp. TRM76323]|uniref:Heparin binding hemagglutinin HbhA n=1 Tax=Streptomyces tamarix TaxID=3078565 RepID=A0ABU3QQW6_9ACTN|nr:hypothetical protein [Streptomyces tamarix]MDT9685170.1 hypothetical protein [Streptomyces tamarix]
MAIIDELRTPLYFAAGTADLAVQQARKIAAEAPSRLDAVRNTDPKAVQEKVAAQAKEAQATLQAKFTELVGGFDTDLKKLGETAQGLALRGVGAAAEYAVKAREAYEKVAEHGEQAVKAWRGEAAEEITEIAIAVEPDSAPAPKTGKNEDTEKAGKAAGAADEADRATGAEEPAPVAPVRADAEAAESGTASAESGTARKTSARRSTARKTASSGTADEK